MTTYPWTCDICQFVAETEEARTAHKADKSLHTEEQLDAASQRIHDALTEIVSKYIPDDLPTSTIMSRTAAIRALIGLSRTSALGALVYGAVNAPMVGLKGDDVLDLVAELFQHTEALEMVKDFADTYAFENAQAKLQKAGMISVPSSDVKH